MPAKFLDTSYILALINPSDQYHAEASAAARRVKPPFLTTEPILLEVGNALSRRRSRQLAIAALHSLRNNPQVEIVPCTTALLERAIDFFKERFDQEWSLTDCTSFVVMQERGLTDALTFDHHFRQAGFQDIGNASS